MMKFFKKTVNPYDEIVDTLLSLARANPDGFTYDGYYWRHEKSGVEIWTASGEDFVKIKCDGYTFNEPSLGKNNRKRIIVGYRIWVEHGYAAQRAAVLAKLTQKDDA